jgi:4-amino-4-deoxy-L-arabinose transferase-like glycosyltransferase
VEADGTFSGKFSKPPLSLWLAAASMNALGPSMFSLRLPFALGMLFAIFVVTAWGTRAHGARLGLAWGATLTLCTATLRWGRYASIEPLFVGFGLAALWWHAEAMLATARRAAWWSLGAGLALTLAFLTKQLAVGLFVLPILVVDLVHRDLGRPGRVRRLALVLATPALLGGAWLWGAWRRAGEALVDIFFVQSVGGRIAGLDEGMNRRELDEVSTIVHDVVAPFPWVLGVVGLAAAWWWSRRSAASDGDETRGRTLLPTAMVALLLTASLLYDHVAATLLPWYVFAFVPPIAAGIAFVVDRAVDVRRDGPPWTWAVAATGVLALGVAVQKRSCRPFPSSGNGRFRFSECLAN